MAGTSQPKLEHHSGDMERTLVLAGGVVLSSLFWIGGAFEVVSYIPVHQGNSVRLLVKLLLWDHNALAKTVLNPFLTRPTLFLLAAGALAISPLAFGASRGLCRVGHDLALKAIGIALLVESAYVLPIVLLPETLSPFKAAWWRVTILFGCAAIVFAVGAVRMRGEKLKASDILRRPHAYDLMDLSGAARLAELKSTGLLVRSSEWPDAFSHKLKARLCIGRLYDEGRPSRYFVAPEIEKLQQTLVVAPTGSGKTTSLAFPWSRELPRKGQSVFVLDFKGDMANHVRPRSGATNGPPVWLFNPLSAESVRWNPLREPVRGTADFEESQDAIAEAIYGEINRGAYQYFDLLDLRILKAGIRAVCHLEMPSLKALHDLFLSEQHLEETLDRIKDSADKDTFARIEADLKASTDSRKYTFTERIQGVRNKLDAFAHPAIRQVTGEKADFSLSSLMDKPSCLIFAAPMRMGLAGETLAAMAVRLIQHQLHRRYGHKGGRLFLILDEFSKLAMDHRQTERFISVSRSAGAVSVVILQDVDQLHHEARASMWGNCQDRYILRGASASTARWLSETLGDRHVWTRTISSTVTKGQKHSSEGGTLSAREESVPVLRPREITLTGGLERGAWLQLHKYSHKPILVDLTRPVTA